MDANRSIINMTLVFPVTAGHVLLGRKKVRLGEGYFNGFGGRVEEHEDINKAAARETAEETGLMVNPDALELMATIDYHHEGKPEINRVHIFIARSWWGEPRHSDEMGDIQWFCYEPKPKSIIKSDLYPDDGDFSGKPIPFEQMWASDKRWLVSLLKGEKFLATCYYRADKTIKRFLKKPFRYFDI